MATFRLRACVPTEVSTSASELKAMPNNSDLNFELGFPPRRATKNGNRWEKRAAIAFWRGALADLSV
jgi:hypothetical protein